MLAIFATIVWLNFPSVLKAQVSTASINGTVRDTSGAVVPGAKVALRNLATGVSHTTVSNATGTYILVQIPPGRYNLTATKEGFKSVQQNVTLVVNQTTTFDFTLTVGTSRQSVTVQALGAELQTSTAGLGETMLNQQVSDLPLNGRNFTQLLELTPGVSTVNVSQNSSGHDIDAVGAFTFPSVNGQINRDNLYLLNGLIDLEALRNEYSVAPIVDDIEEFKMDSHNDQVQFGGVLGGVVNVVTKSGTNKLHGTAWEFLRNSALDSRSPFIATVNPLRQNQFGANIGGPVLLPRYNGRNRTFFFGSYEGLRQHYASEALARVPTPAELSSDLSDLGVPIYNPFSTRPDPAHPGEFLRDEFPNGIIPPSLLDQNMVHLAQTIYPAPTASFVSGYNALNNAPNITTSNEYNIRVDENLSSKDSLWFLYSHQSVPKTVGGGFAGLVDETDYAAHLLGVNWTHTFGPSAVLQVQFGRDVSSQLLYNKLTNVDTQNLIKQTNLSPAYTCGFPAAPSGCLIPSFAITGFVSGGEQYIYRHQTNIWQWRGNLSLLRGKHTLSMGADFNTNDFNQPIDTLTTTFTASQTSNLESPGGTGSALASFLLGVPDRGARRALLETEHGGWVDGVYFQDQWKATDRLTLNLGVRYDVALWPIYGSVQAGNQFVGNMNLNNGTYILAAVPQSCSVTGAAPCIPGGQLPAHVVVTPFKNGRIYHNNYDNIQPRIGLAYRLGSRTVLRTSYGRFYDEWAGTAQDAQNYEGSWPSLGQLNANNLNSSVVTAMAENPLGQANLLPAATPFSGVNYFINPYFPRPYSDQWNFGVERQLRGNTVVSANYVGSHDSRLDLGMYGNTAVTPGPGNAATVASRRPYPYITPTHFDQSIGRSNYNGLQLSLNNRSSSGLSYLISYTWSKSMDIGCSGLFGVEGCSIENPYDINADKSVSGYDLTNVFAASWVYALPFGSGRRFNTGNRFLNYTVGGWKINGIVTMTSGVPYDLIVSGDIANTGNLSGYERLNLIGNPSLPNPTPAEWFNKSAFAVPAPYTYGNLGRNSLRADWFRNLDFSLFCEFPITEQKRFQFRAEAFNLTNTPTWGTPNNNISNPTFGEITGTRSSARQIQLALKFYF